MTTLTTFFFTLAQAAAPVAPAAPGAPAATPPSVMGGILPFILIAIIFYFLIIRPQQKRFKEHQQLIGAVKIGDAVIMSQGIHGIVANVKDSTLVVKVADNVKIEFDKNALTKVVKPTA